MPGPLTLKCRKCHDWKRIKPIFVDGRQPERQRRTERHNMTIQRLVRCGCGHEFWTNHIDGKALA